MRGFFAVGAEGISKAMNLGNLVRSAHAVLSPNQEDEARGGDLVDVVR